MALYEDLAGARDATRRLLTHLDRLSPDELRAPSLLPGWTRAHVVAHLAGNALSHVRMLDGCLAGEVRSQYEEGAAGRAAAIEQLAADPAATVAAHRTACVLLEQRWAGLTDEHWARVVRRLDAEPRPATGLAWARWKEVEVHRVDLSSGYSPADWPAPFAERLLQGLLARPDLPEMVVVAAGRAYGSHGPTIRGTAPEVTAWLAGRSDGQGLHVADGQLPVLPPWA